MKKVVVAEDDGQMRSWLAKIVEDLGYCCLQASNGMRALHLLEDNPEVCLLISDATMPELNGEELVRILHTRGMTEKMPIFYISSLRRFDDVERLKKLGATKFISKPLDRKQLQNLVTEHMTPIQESVPLPA